MLHGSPWVEMHSSCHQMITQQQPKGPRQLLGVTEKSQFLGRPITKAAKSLAVGPHTRAMLVPFVGGQANVCRTFTVSVVLTPAGIDWR